MIPNTERIAMPSTPRERTSIDLNCDLGEGFGAWRFGDDLAMLDLVTSANIACGFHAGDPSTMLRTVRAAAEREVVIGAHVAYRDLAGFGRRFLDVAPDDLYADVVYQVAALTGAASSAGAAVRYVKPHGALYNRIVTDGVQAEAVASAVAAVSGDLAIVGQAGTRIEQAAAAHGLRFVAEGFPDRGYSRDGSLLPRTMPGAVLDDDDLIAQQALMLVYGAVQAADGTPIELRCDTICLHGDAPGAVDHAVAVRRALSVAGVAVRPFLDAESRHG
jgi:UPF0271 protein